MAPKHKQFNLELFILVCKEVREKSVEKEFASLYKRLEKEHAIIKEKETVKWLVGTIKEGESGY
jgi:hypothetical protein